MGAFSYFILIRTSRLQQNVNPCFIGELKIENLWMSLAQRRRLRRVSLRPF
jgi:hypothetical protein